MIPVTMRTGFIRICVMICWFRKETATYGKEEVEIIKLQVLPTDEMPYPFTKLKKLGKRVRNR